MSEGKRLHVSQAGVAQTVHYTNSWRPIMIESRNESKGQQFCQEIYCHFLILCGHASSHWAGMNIQLYPYLLVNVTVEDVRTEIKLKNLYCPPGVCEYKCHILLRAIISWAVAYIAKMTARLFWTYFPQIFPQSPSWGTSAGVEGQLWLGGASCFWSATPQRSVHSTSICHLWPDQGCQKWQGTKAHPQLITT